MDTLSFQAPSELNSKLQQVAKSLDRSKAYIIRAALEEYLEELEDYAEATRYKKAYNPKENVTLSTLKRKHKLS